MTLQKYIQSRKVQEWAKANGYDQLNVYPTGEPWASRGEDTFNFDIDPDGFQELLQESVALGSNLVVLYLVKAEEPEDAVVINPI